MSDVVSHCDECGYIMTHYNDTVNGMVCDGCITSYSECEFCYKRVHPDDTVRVFTKEQELTVCDSCADHYGGEDDE